MSLPTCAGCSTRYAAGLERCPHCGSTEREQARGSVLPAITAECRNEGCRAYGQPRQVMLRTVAVGVVEAPGALICTACWWQMHTAPLRVEEENMPKITVHGGPSNAAEQPAEAPAAEPEAPAEAAGEEESSPGSSSETSSPRPETSSAPSSPALPRRARTTANPSKKARTGASTAGGTATSGPAEEA